jgi:subtilisin family serine protease
MQQWRLGVRVTVLTVLLCGAVHAAPAFAEQRFIARTEPLLFLDGSQIIAGVCKLLGCTVRYPVDGRLGQVFLVTRPDIGDPLAFLALLLSAVGIQDAEIDQVVRTLGADAGSVPPALLDAEPVSFFGTTVRRGYVQQPANGIVGISSAHSQYQLTGAGVTVAVIDTGVDPQHPVLAGVLTPGYDFTRNTASASELTDLDQSTVATLDQSTVATLDETARVNQSTIACLDQSTVATLDTPQYAAFGHGTMVAGVVHLTAPQATIMPLKAFRADGSGYASDVLRAIYHAAEQRAKVINMSFNFATPSGELQRAISYAHGKRMVTVASVGNDGQRTVVYPAGLTNVVGVASTTDFDTLSAFSNFGADVAWVAAPGEGIVTSYPFGTYAAAWGTSFSAPFAAGAAALLAELESKINAPQAADAEGHAVWISPDVKRGRLAIPSAIDAWRRWLYGY